MSALQVGSPQRGRESILGVVGQGQGFLFGVKRLQGHDGSEDFFLVGAALGSQPFNDGGGHEKTLFVPFRMQSMAATKNGAPFLTGQVNVVQNFVHVVF